jgi:hypothetical protein
MVRMDWDRDRTNWEAKKDEPFREIAGGGSSAVCLRPALARRRPRAIPCAMG